MGLDAVEIVMQTEERFGIEISDYDASQIRTVGEFYSLVLRNLAAPNSARCLTAMAFYRLRRAFIDVMGIDRRQFHPQRPFRELVPVRQTRRAWRDLSAASGLEMPVLRRPTKLTRALAVAGLVVFLGGAVLAAFKVIPLWQTWGCGGVGIFLITVVTGPLAVHPPGTCQTVGDLAHAVFDANAGVLIKSAGELNREDVWRSLRMLIGEELGIDAESISASDRFVEDLNCG